MDLLSYTVTNPILLILLSFAGGLFAGFLARKFLKSSNTMVFTVMVLPAIVCAALLAINGSLGAGIAILGVFGLVRFRSMPGSGSDIVVVFYAMVIGLMISTGMIVSAILLILLIGAGIIGAVAITERVPARYNLHILVPEDTGNLSIFDDILEKYARKVKPEKIRTTNMGSMYELVYSLQLIPGKTAKMLDEVRVHNHNLNVSLGIARPESGL